MDLSLPEEGTNMAVWFFGRGTSIACGLEWSEPREWQSSDRDIRIEKIKKALRLEMQKIPIGVNPYHELLLILERSTKPDWKHLFATTNWDFLLQREISKKRLEALPNWLVSSHVFHLNGSAEEGSQENRSPFLLDTDPYGTRRSTFETNQALAYMVWEKLFIVVGVSFKCKTDESLLLFLQLHEDKLPFGGGKWIILDPNEKALNDTCFAFRRLFPAADVVPIQEQFQDWIRNGLPQLGSCGVI